MMEGMRFHHIGIATDDISKELEEMIRVFGNPEICELCYDPAMKVELCLVNFHGLNMEFVSGEVVKNLVDKRIKLYHICYEVSNLDLKIKELTQNGALLISEPKEATLFDQRRVAFLMLRNGIIIELLEVR